MYTSGARKN